MLVRHLSVPSELVATQVEAEPAEYRLEPAAFLAAVALLVSPVWQRPASSLLWASASVAAPEVPAAHMVVAVPAAPASAALTAFVPVVYRPVPEVSAEPVASERREAYMTAW